MTHLCNAPFCTNSINKKSYVYCWPHRAEREKFNVKCMELVMPLWSVKNCKIHGHLRRKETISNFSNPSGKNSPRCKYCKKIKLPYCPIKSKISNDLNKSRRKHQKLMKDYQISLSEYESMVISQNNLCAICQNPQSKFNKNSLKVRSLAVDHNHLTGKVRALLCTSCNTSIGLLGENIQLFKKVIAYLRHHETA